MLNKNIMENNKKTTIVLTIPKVTNFRKIYESKDEGGSMYGATCSILDIFSIRDQIDKLLDINPRTQKESSAPSKAMRETLRDAQEMFVFRNRGMTFIAYDAVWDNKTHALTLTFKVDPNSNNESNGLADGGHTYEVINNFVNDIDEAERKDIVAEIRLDILTGFDNKSDEVSEIVQARNTSTQVKDESLLNSRGVFDLIKNSLKGEPYENNIAYYENERIDEKNPESGYRTNKVANILSYLMCFDQKEFTENIHPIKAYSSKKKPVEWYVKKWKDDKEDLLALTSLLKEILSLRDYVESQIPRAWNKWSGRFGDQKGVKKLKKETKLDFSNYKVEYDVPGGYVYPILASFRSLLVKEGNVYKFRTDPKKLFDSMNIEERRSLIHKLKGVDNDDPQAMGKSNALYDTCYGALRGYYYESLNQK